jgi:hypothetical protein
LAVPRIKLIYKLLGEPKMEWMESQFGPSSNTLFSPKKWANSRLLPLARLAGPKQSLKEVAAHETFAAFFRLNW